ncbi:MAG: SDR family oxidoreductase [Bacteroidia bacterium]|nr:SDR family oxidoreductase [Bacteroidia bacterium]
MNIFITGATGFLGGELLVLLSKIKNADKIYCLIRADSADAAEYRLRKVFKLHNDYFDKEKIIPVLGNLGEGTLSDILINNKALNDINIIIHSAANTSFARIYDDLVEKVNILGLNEVIWWSKTLKKLETFVYVGTATITGKNALNRLVKEEESPNLKSIHFVKYTYTKMLGEIILRENLPEEKILIVRPSIIMGDTRPWVPRSYVILWALATMNLMRLVPVNPLSDLDIIPVDYASQAIIELLFKKRNHKTYHISSGIASISNTLKITNNICDYFHDRPGFKFVEKKMLSQMKNWSKSRLQPNSELFNYPEHLEYWDKAFADKSQLRILFGGLEPYLEFIELGQIFDNTRLLSDTGIGNPEPAHNYICRSIKYLEEIDVFEGALDP